MSENSAFTPARAAIAGLVAINLALVGWTMSEKRSQQQTRDELWSLLRPVALKNCTMARYGRDADGGYTVCTNLTAKAEVAYSYGISGVDSFGCQASRDLGVAVHQYDCFNTQRVECPGGNLIFHEECVGDKEETIDGLLFDSVANQFNKNGDTGKEVLFKMDIDGGEIDSILGTPPETLKELDQIVLEVHGVTDPKVLEMVRYLTQYFYVADVHANNNTCVDDREPFPAYVVEVLFVNKSEDEVDPGRTPPYPNPTWRPNHPDLPDCQVRM